MMALKGNSAYIMILSLLVHIVIYSTLSIAWMTSWHSHLHVTTREPSQRIPFSRTLSSASSISSTQLSVLSKPDTERDIKVIPSSIVHLPSSNTIPPPPLKSIPHVVLVAGFESFNKELYLKAASQLSSPIHLSVFADREIRTGAAIGVGGASEEHVTNPLFTAAVHDADVFIGSLIFDYDDVMAVTKLLPHVKGPRLLFECATELMTFNRVGTFTMDSSLNQTVVGPPPAIKAILSKFSSGKEEDKLAGYIKLLKVGPDLLKFVPGEKAGDLRTWLELYRYWNQGGLSNVSAMFQLIHNLVTLSWDRSSEGTIQSTSRPANYS